MYWSLSKEGLEENEFKKLKASDVYGFGELMEQIFTESVYCCVPSGGFEDIPNPMLKLTKSCLNSDFRKRPDINKILYILEKWCGNPPTQSIC